MKIIYGKAGSGKTAELVNLANECNPNETLFFAFGNIEKEYLTLNCNFIQCQDGLTLKLLHNYIVHYQEKYNVKVKRMFIDDIHLNKYNITLRDTINYLKKIENQCDVDIVLTHYKYALI